MYKCVKDLAGFVSPGLKPGDSTTHSGLSPSTSINPIKKKSLLVIGMPTEQPDPGSPLPMPAKLHSLSSLGQRKVVTKESCVHNKCGSWQSDTSAVVLNTKL